jgi:TonB family protein
VTPEALQCAEGQIPPSVRIYQEASDSNRLETVAHIDRPPLAGVVTAIRRCFADFPGRPNADNVAVSYILLTGASRVLGQLLASQGITQDTLQRVDTLALLTWLSANGVITTPDQSDELNRRLGRLHISVDARSNTFTYLWMRRMIDLFSILMRPPAHRAVWLGGAIEANDYPHQQQQAGINGAGTVLFEVRPDGTVGRCVISRVTAGEIFGRAACRAVTRRYHYQPATDADGRPVRDAVLVTIDWQMPG